MAKSITDKDGFIEITIPPGAYELEILKNEIEGIIIREGHFTEADYPLNQTKSLKSRRKEISRQDALISFTPDDSIRDIMCLNPETIHEKYHLSPNPVDILSIDNIFPEAYVAQGMIFKGKRSRNDHKLTMNVSRGYNYFENF